MLIGLGGLLIVLISGLLIFNQSVAGPADHHSSSAQMAQKEDHHRMDRHKQDRRDPNDLDHAPLYKIGQYYDSSKYGRIRLKGISTERNLVFSEGQLTTTINWAKVCTNTPKTAAQRTNSASDYNLDKVVNPYTYLKVRYTVKNLSHNAVSFGGVRQVALANGTTFAGTDELVIDDGQSEQLAPHAKRVFTIHVLVDRFTDQAQPQSIRLKFNGAKGSLTLKQVSKGFNCRLPITYTPAKNV